MNTLQKKIYDCCPQAVQDVMINLYGIRNFWRLYRWRAINKVFEPSEYWSRLEQRTYVASALRVILGHAVRYVPRYLTFRNMAPEIDDASTDIFGILSRFPIVNREEILRDPGAFISSAFNKKRLSTTATSGTTGSPFITWFEPQALLTSDALWWRRTVWGGHRNGDWIARLVGDPVIPLSDHKAAPPWRRSWPDRRLYFSTYHLNVTTARQIAEKLLKVRPAFLMGYPSALDTLARLNQGGLDMSAWKPKAILFSSEPMHEHQRSAIQTFIDAPLRGLYGCAERVISAAQCDRGSYHLSVIDGFVEGQFGEVPIRQPARITGLLNRAMPLIRYEIGDSLVPLIGQKCKCGRTLPLIDPVVTKVEDSLVTTSGRVISPSILTWAFKNVKGLKKSQVIQRSESSVEVLLQISVEDFPDACAALASRLSEMFFDEFKVNFRRVETLHLGAAGKTRFVVNQHKKPSSKN